MQDARLTYMDGGKMRGGTPAMASGLWQTGLVLAIFACAGVASGQPASADETVVRLYAHAVIMGDEVRLSDVAELPDGTAGMAGDWVVVPAPPAGSTRVVSLTRIQSVLAGHGANLGHWVFRGSTSCTVSRPVNVQNATARGASDRSLTGSGEPAVSRHHGEENTGAQPNHLIDPNTLEGVVRDHMAAKLAQLGGTPVIDFSAGAARYLRLARPTYDFKITDRSSSLLGFTPLEISVIEKATGMQQMIQMLARVSIRKPVVVSARAINRGQTIVAGDLLVENRVFERIDGVGLTDIAPLVGQRARRLIRKGDQVSEPDLEPIPLVQRNDMVRVIVRRAGMEIVASARALSGGSYGDTVELQNHLVKRSAKSFFAVVTGPREAEVKDTPALVAAADSPKGDS